MSRRRMQGSATDGEASTEDGAEKESTGEGSTPPPAPPVQPPAQGDPRGEHKPLGNPRGVRIMFNACERDESGNVTRPGERVVSEDEALALVKQGVATLL